MAESLDQKLKRLEDNFEKTKSILDRAEGSYQASLARLREEFKLNSLEEANEELNRLNKEADKLQTMLNEMVEEIDNQLREIEE